MRESNLDSFFNPRSVTLIGATNTPGFGHGIPLFWKKNGWKYKQYKKQIEFIKQYGYDKYLNNADKWQRAHGKLKL